MFERIAKGSEAVQINVLKMVLKLDAITFGYWLEMSRLSVKALSLLAQKDVTGQALGMIARWQNCAPNDAVKLSK